MKFLETVGMEPRISSKFLRGMTVTVTSVEARASKARICSEKRSSPKISSGFRMYRMDSPPLDETEASSTSPSTRMKTESLGSPSENMAAPRG